MLKEIYNYLFHKSILLLNRNQLGSIDLKDVRDKELTENEIKERNASIASSYKWIEYEIKKCLVAQEEFMSTGKVDDGGTVIVSSDTNYPTIFGRGCINMADLLLEQFKMQKGGNSELTKPKEEFNKHKVI